MNYKAKLLSGEEVLVQNDGEQTKIQLQNDDSGSHESQSTSFETGKWSKAPTLFAKANEAVLQIETAKEPLYFTVGNIAIDRLDAAPELKGAEKVELKETDEAPSLVEMKPMATMKPIATMKPLEPMEPLKPLS